MEYSITGKISAALTFVMLWLFILTAFLLFLPLGQVSAEFATRIEANRFYLYTALIVEASLFISHIVSYIYSMWFSKHFVRQSSEFLHHAVNTLDFAEKALLREFVLQRQSVLHLPVAEPTVKSLCDSGILTFIKYDEDDDQKACFAISRKARPLITYRAIGLSRSGMSEEQLSQIMQSRPGFARSDDSFTRTYRGSGSYLNHRNEPRAA